LNHLTDPDLVDINEEESFAGDEFNVESVRWGGLR
jgi:hypothetical protein